MIDANGFIQEFLEHRQYDPQAAHDYYMRTRELKGRKTGAAKPATATASAGKGDPRAYKDGYGKPLPKLGKRFEEDQSPLASPGGSTKLTTYDQGPHGLGKATYSDGFVYDGKVGWIKPQAGHARFNAAQAKLDKVRMAVKKAPPQKRATLQKKVDAAQKKLDALKLQSRGSRENQ